MKDILENIKQRRKDLGITQAEMAKRLRITQPQYQRIETAGNPSLKTLKAIALALDMELVLVPKEKSREINDVLRPQKLAQKVLSLFDQFEVEE